MPKMKPKGTIKIGTRRMVSFARIGRPEDTEYEVFQYPQGPILLVPKQLLGPNADRTLIHAYMGNNPQNVKAAMLDMEGEVEQMTSLTG